MAWALGQVCASFVFVSLGSPEEEGTPAEGLPPADWPAGMSRFMIEMAGLRKLGSAMPGHMVRGSVRKQVGQAVGSKPSAALPTGSASVPAARLLPC